MSTITAIKYEVKLTRYRNPEGADAVFARYSRFFVVRTLSYLSKKRLDQPGVLWVEMQNPNGFVGFGKALDSLDASSCGIVKAVL